MECKKCKNEMEFIIEDQGHFCKSKYVYWCKRCGMLLHYSERYGITDDDWREPEIHEYLMDPEEI